jgi:RNA polymerase sigma factor (TIGR02999 family)
MGEVTMLLQQWRAGDKKAEARLFQLVYPELHRLARLRIKGNHRDQTLQPSALINEVYIRLVAVEDQNFPNRRSFFGYAAKAMRTALVDHWRRRRGAVFTSLGDTGGRLSQKEKIELGLAVHSVLDELEKVHPDWSAVVEMKVFLDLTNAAVADALGLGQRTVERIWHDARFWLFEKLGPESRHGSL